MESRASLVSHTGLYLRNEYGRLTIVQSSVRIIGIIHDHRSPKPITILCPKMRVVPESTSMVSSRELIRERRPRRDGTLTDALSAIRERRPFLE